MSIRSNLNEQLRSFDNSIAYYRSQIALSDDEKEKRDLLAKIDYLEKILRGESPEVMVFDAPYDTFFKPEKMKEATFKVEGDANE